MEFPRNTRLESKIKHKDPNEFLKARPSNTPYPINSFEPTYCDRNFINSRDQTNFQQGSSVQLANPVKLANPVQLANPVKLANPVQLTNQVTNDSNSQFNYFMNNFETLNRSANCDNRFMEAQPINTRYTQFNNERKQELNEFRALQIPQYNDRTPVNTRKDRNEINTNSYIPNSKI